MVEKPLLLDKIVDENEEGILNDDVDLKSMDWSELEYMSEKCTMSLCPECDWHTISLDSFCLLLDDFKPDIDPALNETTNEKISCPSEKLLAAIGTRLGYSKDKSQALVDKYFRGISKAVEIKRSVQLRKTEVLDNIKNENSKEIVEKRLAKINSIAELEAIENIANFDRVADTKFEKILEQEIKSARESSLEVTFGMLLTDDLVDKIVTYNSLEQLALLKLVRRIFLCSDETLLPNSEFNSSWIEMAVRFKKHNKKPIEDKILGYLEDQILDEKLLDASMRLLFAIYQDIDFEQDNQESLKKSLSRLTSLAKRSRYSTNIGLQACILKCFDPPMGVSDVRAEFQAIPAAILAYAASVHSEESVLAEELFQEFYEDGFSMLANIARDDEYNIILIELLSELFEKFHIVEMLEMPGDCMFFASLVALPLRAHLNFDSQLHDNGDETYGSSFEPFLHLLDHLVNLASQSENTDYYPAVFEVASCLVCGKESAADVVNTLRRVIDSYEHPAFMDNLILWERMFEKCDIREFGHLDIILILRSIFRSPGTQRFLQCLHAIAKQTPTSVLTATVNHSERGTFSLLNHIKTAVERERTHSNTYVTLLNSLRVIELLVAQAIHEDLFTELRVIFKPDEGIDMETFEDRLRELGFSSSSRNNVEIDDTDFSTPKIIEWYESEYDNQKHAFMHDLRLAIEHRRSLVHEFVAQSVKLIEEVYRSYSSWRYADPREKHEIGLCCTDIMLTLVSMPEGCGLGLVRKSVLDSIMNDTSTQRTLVSNITDFQVQFRLMVVHDLVISSLRLFTQVVKIDEYFQQKVNLISFPTLLSTVAMHAGNGNEVASQFLEEIMIVLSKAREQRSTVAGIPSMVALVSPYSLFANDLVTQVLKGKTFSMSLVNTALEFEPGIVARIVKNEEFLKSIVNQLNESVLLTNPSMYLYAIHFFKILWQKNFAATLNRLWLISPSLLDIVTQSLTRDCGDLNDDNPDFLEQLTFQFRIRSFAFEILTMDMNLEGEDRRKKKFEKPHYDEWLKHFVLVRHDRAGDKEVNSAAKKSRISLEWFRSTTCKDDTPQAMTDERLRRIGKSFVFDIELLRYLNSSDYIAFFDAVDLYNRRQSASEAHLELFYSWKAYFETRVLNGEQIQLPVDNIVDTTTQSLSEILHKFDRDMFRESYLDSVADLVMKLVHRRIYGRVDTTNTALDGNELTAQSSTTVYPNDSQSSKLELLSAKTVDELLHNLCNALEKLRGVSTIQSSTIVSVCSTMMILLQAYESVPDQRLVDLVSIPLVIKTVSKTMIKLRNDLELFDVCVPLLCFLIVFRGDLENVALDDLFRLASTVFREQSEMLVKKYIEQQELIAWLHNNDVEKLRVRVLVDELCSITTPGSDTRSDSWDLKFQSLVQQLGFKDTRVHDRGEAPAAYRDREVANDAFQDVSITRLLFEYGVCSLESLKELDIHALQGMGITRLTDRKRLLDLIQGSRAEDRQSGKRQKRFHVSRKNGFHYQQSFNKSLSRVQATLRLLHTTAQVAPQAIEEYLKNLDLVSTLTRDPLLLAYDASSVWDDCRGYTVFNERDGIHVTWCHAMRFVSCICTKHMDQSLNFLFAYRGTIIKSLEAFCDPGYKFTMAALEELHHTVELITCLGEASLKWPLRVTVYEPILNTCHQVLLNIMFRSSMKSDLLKPFAQYLNTFNRGPRTLLMALTKPVSRKEHALSKKPYNISRVRKESRDPGGLLSPKAKTRPSTIGSDMVNTAGETMVSHLHVKIEFWIASTLKQLLKLFTSSHVIKSPAQLQRDDPSGISLSAKNWAPATIPFPLDVEPNLLHEILTYVGLRLESIPEIDTSATSSIANDPWTSLISYVGSSAILLMLLCLELTVHERQRKQALGKPTAQFNIESTVKNLQAYITKDVAPICEKLMKLGRKKDAEFIKIVGDRLVKQLELLHKGSSYVRLEDATKVPGYVIAPVAEKETVNKETRFLIWIAESQSDCARWQYQFKCWNMSNTIFYVHAPWKDPALVDTDDDSIFWYRNGVNEQRKPRAEMQPECGYLKHLIAMPNGVQSIEKLLKLDSESTWKELISLVSASNENSEAVWKSTKGIMDNIRELQTKYDIDSNQIILGGFQNGGGQAMTTGLMLALEGFLVNRIINFHGHFPLAHYFAELKLRKGMSKQGDTGGSNTTEKSTEFPEIVYRIAVEDPIVTPIWARLIGRCLAWHSPKKTIDYGEIENAQRNDVDLQLVYDTIMNQSDVNRESKGSSE